MRLITLSAAALLASASMVFAAPASVSIDVAPKLQKKFEKTYGVREAALLTADLRKSVEASLAKTGMHDGARIELTLTHVKPNRPTFKQLGDTPGLSLQSFGIGGAAVTGKVVAADGAVIPVKYSWYESDIRQSHSRWTWSDAELAFDRLARKLARGQELAQR